MSKYDFSEFSQQKILDLVLSPSDMGSLLDQKAHAWTYLYNTYPKMLPKHVAMQRWFKPIVEQKLHADAVVVFVGFDTILLLFKKHEIVLEKQQALAKGQMIPVVSWDHSSGKFITEQKSINDTTRQSLPFLFAEDEHDLLSASRQRSVHGEAMKQLGQPKRAKSLVVKDGFQVGQRILPANLIAKAVRAKASAYTNRNVPTVEGSLKLSMARDEWAALRLNAKNAGVSVEVYILAHLATTGALE